MTHGNGPRRRWADPSADPAEDDWLAGLHPSARDQDAGFDAPPTRWNGPVSPVPYSSPPAWGRQGNGQRPEPQPEPQPGPMPDEEPIFRAHEPLRPGEAPPILHREPLLKYMEPRSRPVARAASYTGRRRTRPPEADPVVPRTAPPNQSAWPASAPTTSWPASAPTTSWPASAPTTSWPASPAPPPATAPPVSPAPRRRFRGDEPESPAGYDRRAPSGPRESTGPRDSTPPAGWRPYAGTGPYSGPEQYPYPPAEAYPPAVDPYQAAEAYPPAVDPYQAAEVYPPAVDPYRGAESYPPAADPYRGGPVDEPEPPPRAEPTTPSGGMRAVRPDTTGGMRAVRPDTTGGMRAVRPDTTGGMRAVRPDTTGGMRAVRPDTTGGLPRIGTTTSGGMRALRGESTGALPRAGSTTGAIRQPARAADPGPPMQRPRSRWLAALSTVGVLVLLAVCGLGTYFIVKDERAGSNDVRNNTGASDTPKAAARDISTRDADPAPLAVPEVFPGQQVGAQRPYLVLKTQVADDCGVAAVDDLSKLLADQGCSQVVRATLKTPDGAYLVTAGIFNLRDERGAVAVHDNIKPTVDAQKGRFTGLLAGAGTEALVKAPMILGWHARGHFLAYCIVARADSKGFDAGDQNPDRIQADILTAHLRDGVIGARAVANASASPAQS